MAASVMYQFKVTLLQTRKSSCVIARSILPADLLFCPGGWGGGGREYPSPGRGVPHPDLAGGGYPSPILAQGVPQSCPAWGYASPDLAGGAGVPSPVLAGGPQSWLGVPYPGLAMGYPSPVLAQGVPHSDLAGDTPVLSWPRQGTLS